MGSTKIFYHCAPYLMQRCKSERISVFLCDFSMLGQSCFPHIELVGIGQPADAPSYSPLPHLYHTIPYPRMPKHNVAYHTIPSYTMLYRIMFYHTIPYQCDIIRHPTIPSHVIPIPILYLPLPPFHTPVQLLNPPPAYTCPGQWALQIIPRSSLIKTFKIWIE